VRVPANKKISLTFWTVVGADRAELMQPSRGSTIRKLRRQAMLAWTCSQVQTRHLGLSLADAANVQKLARYLIYPDAFLRLPAESIASGLASSRAYGRPAYPATIRFSGSDRRRRRPGDRCPGTSLSGIYARPWHDDRLCRRQ
jgi:cellobiose phosphorylase